MDILALVCNWLGIYYEMQNNRQMSMHCYLDAFDLAERSNDLLKQSILLNNIATQFHCCQNYELAKEYYIQAFDYFELYGDVCDDNPHYAQLTANIVSACCFLHDVETADYYMKLLKSTNKNTDHENQVQLCELMIANCKKDVVKVRDYTDQLFAHLDQHQNNLHQLFATFLVVGETFVTLREANYAKKVLEYLNGLCEEEE